MAAKVNFTSVARNKCGYLLVAFIVVVCLITQKVETATTQDPGTTADPVTVPPTNPPTTVPQTTQVQTTTTTLPPTTTIAPVESRSTIAVNTDVGLCACDLKGNECDVNCCCDIECSAADKEAFVCSDVSVVIDDRLCYQQQVFLFINAPYTNGVSDEGLFCIYFDNYASRNYYSDPDFVQDMPLFDSYIESYSGPSFADADNSSTEPVFNFNSFYQSGDPVYVIYPIEARGYFSIPAPMLSSECVDNNPIAYLKEQNTECYRTIADLATECQANIALNSSTYYAGFRVVGIPGLFGYIDNDTLPTSTAAPVTTAGTTVATNVTTTTVAPSTTPVSTLVDPGVVQSVYENVYTLPIDTDTLPHLCRLANGTITSCGLNPGDVPQPAFAGTTCSNVVVETRYTFITNGTNGVSSVRLQFVFADITAANLPLMQRTSISYDSLNDNNEVVDRSGNPGYIVGKPVRYGELISSTTVDGVTTQSIDLNSDPLRWLTVVKSSGTGVCVQNQVDRKTVNFGDNIRSGCVIRLNIQNTDCAAIQTSIIEALEGPDHSPSLDPLRNVWIDNNRYVATFGNTVPSKVGDWVKVITTSRPIPSNAATTDPSTCSLSMGLHIQFLYASVGALANPQSKILGVALMYDAAQTVSYRCVGAFCQTGNGNEQIFEVSQTVSFVDVSQPAVKVQGEAPIFIARVPNDFFYPFLYEAGSGCNSRYTYNYWTMSLSSVLTVILALTLGS